jgi:asparagine synthase (glutamine-hydrolysing)
MCGLIGAIGKDSYSFVQANLPFLQRRGPDSQGIISVNNNLTLGVARLAMTDPHPRSNQPMLDPLNGNIIVFNGEIYNYSEIKKNLNSHGIKFNTNSDTEVLLKALDYHGTNYVDNLEGMFAFAFYLKRENKLFLSRDYLGKKPLYYSLGTNYFVFSSQINLVKNYTKNLSLDQNALMTYLKFGYLIDPNTMYEEIKSVNPGETLELDLKSLSLDKVNNFVPKSIINPPNEEINETLKSSIYERIKGHPKVAISLSGGIDSTILAIEAARSGIQADAYTMHWSESDKPRYNFDSIAAQKIAKNIGLNHVIVEMPKIKDLESKVIEYVTAMGEPNSNPSGLSMMALYSQIADDGFRLVLTGDGADEVLGGYERYKIISKLNILPSFESKILKKILSSNNPYHKQLINYFSSVATTDSPEFWNLWHQLVSNKFLSTLTHGLEIVDSTFKKDYLTAELSNTKNKVANVMIRDLKIWLTMESNRKLDRVSMWNSIEARSPYQSEKFIGVGYKSMVDTNFKYLDKILLTKKYPDIYGLGVNSIKMGFMSPLGHWLRNSPDLIHDSLQYLDVKFGFDKNELSKLYVSPKKNQYTNFRFLWNLIILAKWHEVG